jgi:xanthine phosphoribosyltransferase
VKEYYSYAAFSKDTRKIIQKVKPFDAQTIVAVARGGLSLSHAMAEGLNIRDVQSIRTELYDKEAKRSCLTLFGKCDFLEKTERVLVVDDIADSGETLRFVMEYLRTNFPDKEFLSCTLFYKKSSVYEPDIWINEANAWIEFFWEKDFI